VDVQRGVTDVGEEVLAPRLGPLEHASVETLRVGRKASLRARGRDLTAAEGAVEAIGERVDGVALGHPRPPSACCASILQDVPDARRTGSCQRRARFR
jgi:hypothetical protein